MAENDVDKRYVEKYIEKAKTAPTEEQKLNALYRAGSQMEVIPCNGDVNLTSIQQQRIFDAAAELLEE